jgi:hypothetical protein
MAKFHVLSSKHEKWRRSRGEEEGVGDIYRKLNRGGET